MSNKTTNTWAIVLQIYDNFFFLNQNKHKMLRKQHTLLLLQELVYK